MLTKAKLHSLFAGQLDLKVALADTSRIIQDHIKAGGIVFSIYNQERDELIVQYVRLGKEYKSLEISARGYRHSLSQDSVEARAIKNKEIIHINKSGLINYDLRVANIFEAWGISDMLVLPVFYDNILVGSILAFKHEGVFEPSVNGQVQKLITNVAPYIYTISKYYLFEQKENLINTADKQRRETLNIISKLSNIHELDMIYRVILTELLTHYHFQIGSIHRSDGSVLRPTCWTTLNLELSTCVDSLIEWAENSPAPLDVAGGVLSASFENNTYVYVKDAELIRNLPMSKRDKEAMALLRNARSNVFIPIRQGHAPIGVIWLSSIGKVVPLDEEDRTLLEGVGSFLGTVLENAEMYLKIREQNTKIQQLNNELESKIIKLHEMATHDYLTGLYNFGYFQKAMDFLAQTSDRSARNSNSMCLVIADIDHFKLFNDTHGHEAGNIALKHVADIIAKHAREGDIVCRYGGEEFTVLLPKCDLEGAKHYAERVRHAIESTPVLIDGVPIPMTISLGCTRFLENETARSCISRADDQLYKAKRNGRNRVEAI